jgi:alkanesulfonate monooxygenase SsuD/methylene tetrahydromethanopterin reductase-like flavin-dependent oxidoreductase (luciferase family)
MAEFRTLRAGVFLPPFHPNDEDPLLCMERDFELMQWLDKLGFAEAWIGEHHSGGYEATDSPNCSSPPRPSAPGTSGSAPGSFPCPTTIP